MFKPLDFISFDGAPGADEEKSAKRPKPKLPPKDGDEWLTREGLASAFPEIPDNVVHQHKLDYHAETLVGTEEEISETLTGKLGTYVGTRNRLHDKVSTAGFSLRL